MTTFKSLETIKKETEKKRYYRPFDYMRMVALTNFMEKLSIDPTVNIISACPSIAHIRSDSTEQVEKTAKFVIGLWVRFKINDTVYYIQMDENPFFDSYISSSVINHKQKTIKTTRLRKVNHILYNGIEWVNSEENIKQFMNNLHEAMININMTDMNFNEKYVDNRDRNVQTIYNITTF